MTSFYNPDLLATSDKKNRYGSPGLFVVPSSEEILKKLEKKSPTYYKHCISNNYTTPKIRFIFDQQMTKVNIMLGMGPENNNSITVTLAQITLSTISANCGSMLISNLCSDFAGLKFGTFLFETVLKYIEKAGYSYILLNVAGYQAEFGRRFFGEKFGFQPFPQSYENKRSGNWNTWYEKYTNNVQVTTNETAEKYTTVDNTPEELYNEA